MYLRGEICRRYGVLTVYDRSLVRPGHDSRLRAADVRVRVRHLHHDDVALPDALLWRVRHPIRHPFRHTIRLHPLPSLQVRGVEADDTHSAHISGGLLRRHTVCRDDGGQSVEGIVRHHAHRHEPLFSLCQQTHSGTSVGTPSDFDGKPQRCDGWFLRHAGAPCGALLPRLGEGQGALPRHGANLLLHRQCGDDPLPRRQRSLHP